MCKNITNKIPNLSTFFLIHDMLILVLMSKLCGYCGKVLKVFEGV